MRGQTVKIEIPFWKFVYSHVHKMHGRKPQFWMFVSAEIFFSRPQIYKYRWPQSSNFNFTGSLRNRYFKKYSFWQSMPCLVSVIRCLASTKDVNATFISVVHSWSQSVVSQSIEGSPALLVQVTGPWQGNNGESNQQCLATWLCWYLHR